MNTRAKFECTSKTETKDNGWSYILQAVVGDSEENKKFFKWTPGGNINIFVVRDDVFNVGKQYYVDFTEAK